MGTDSESEDEQAEESTKVKPYNVLLEFLASSRAKDDTHKSKRRKIDRAATRDIIAEDVGSDIDVADEEAEGEGDADEAFQQSDDEDESPVDPFEIHFASPSSETLKGIGPTLEKEWQSIKLSIPGIGRGAQTIPKGSQPLHGKKFDTVKSLHLKKRLASPFQEKNGELSEFQKAFSQYVFSYQDLLFAGRTVRNSDELRRMYCLHALNHIFKTRDRVVKDNFRLSHGDDDLELRDQGFTRPKVLFILPTRNCCVQVVDTLVALAATGQQENKKRFQDTYSIPPDQERLNKNKPEDFKALFGGNHDDLFRVGVKFTRKTMKFFSQFYNSDIILASPLGLRLAIGDDGDKKRDFDFLSSIELVVVDQADALLMQNWDHVEHVFKHLNLIPKDPHGCDFGRVRDWYLDGNARYLRQTIVLSAYGSPELNSLFNQHMLNIGGRVKTQPEYPGVMGDLGLQVRQTFTRFDAPAPADDPEARFKFFKTVIIPVVLRNKVNGGGVLVFISSYFDFVRVRNYLNTLDLSFGAISEETPAPDVTRARSHFMTGRHPVLLYTERAHHFRRYELQGVREIVFYSLPENQTFYKEIAGGFLLKSIGEGKVEAERCKARVMFSKWDAMKLERVVGTTRVKVMCNDVGDTFEFV